MTLEELGAAVLERAPKRATGIYITSTGITYGFRTSPKKYPKNFIPFTDIEAPVVFHLTEPRPFFDTEQVQEDLNLLDEEDTIDALNDRDDRLLEQINEQKYTKGAIEKACARIAERVFPESPHKAQLTRAMLVAITTALDDV